MQTELIAVPREETGKKTAKKMRHDGRIPAVIYGHGFDTRLLSLDEKEFKDLLRHGLHGLLNLKVEGAKEDAHTVVVKEIQRDPIKDYILHVDFQKIRGDEELHAEVALQFVGEPAGVKAGGILQHYLYEVSVQCLPKDLPESIELDISGLELKENIRISDLISLEGVKYTNNPEEIVVAVALKRVKEEVTAAEELFEEEAAEAAEEGAEAEAPTEEETE
jgi:large subunit ribosomal protein L25